MPFLWLLEQKQRFPRQYLILSGRNCSGVFFRIQFTHRRPYKKTITPLTTLAGKILNIAAMVVMVVRRAFETYRCCVGIRNLWHSWKEILESFRYNMLDFYFWLFVAIQKYNNKHTHIHIITNILPRRAECY